MSSSSGNFPHLLLAPMIVPNPMAKLERLEQEMQSKRNRNRSIPSILMEEFQSIQESSSDEMDVWAMEFLNNNNNDDVVVPTTTMTTLPATEGIVSPASSPQLKPIVSSSSLPSFGPGRLLPPPTTIGRTANAQIVVPPQPVPQSVPSNSMATMVTPPSKTTLSGRKGKRTSARKNAIPKHLPEAVKNVLRKERNKRHARSCRQRRKQTTDDLAKTLADLRHQNQALRQAVCNHISPQELQAKMDAVRNRPNLQLIAQLQSTDKKALMINSKTKRFLDRLRQQAIKVKQEQDELLSSMDDGDTTATDGSSSSSSS